MKSFRDKYPGLTEDQLRIKYKVWEREKERQRLLEESKKYKSPWDTHEHDDGGAYSGIFDVDSSQSGIVSDGAIRGASVSFIYPDNLSYKGSIVNTISNDNGSFLIPRSFGSGRVSVYGGTDTVLGLPHIGSFSMDGQFFHNYKSVTPLTHIANHIWDCTPTRTPREAIYLVIDYIFDFFKIPHNDINDIERIFNSDPIISTLEGYKGSKEIQAINTLIEVYAELIGSLKSNYREELEYRKMESYREIGDALLSVINGQSNINYSDDVFKYHISGQGSNHDRCCLELIYRASDMIKSSLSKDYKEATENIQAVNFMVKNEWIEKSLVMTQDSEITPKKIWASIDLKDTDPCIPIINIPTIN